MILNRKFALLHLLINVRKFLGFDQNMSAPPSKEWIKTVQQWATQLHIFTGWMIIPDDVVDFYLFCSSSKEGIDLQGLNFIIAPATS